MAIDIDKIMEMDKRKPIVLSELCWKCFDSLKDVSFATTYTHFFTMHSGYLRDGFRKAHPDSIADIYRFLLDGQEVGISISKDAIQYFAPRIQEFAASGLAIKAIGAYENYMRGIEKQGLTIMSDKFTNLAKTHKVFKKPDWTCSKELGRGIDIFQELFGYSPPPGYRPSLILCFELRNASVHNSSIATQAVHDASMDLGTPINIGDPVPWNLHNCFELHHLFVDYLPVVDSLVSPILQLKTKLGIPYWFTKNPL
jgi:hypothetical protein